MLRYTVHFEGRVQGVGFRFTAVRMAERYAVAGSVKNLPDGRVLLTAEGQRDDLDAFLDDVRRAMGRHIRRESIDISPATGEFGQPQPGGLTIAY